VLRPGHDTSCPYKNRCEFFNFTELRLDAIALGYHPPIWYICTLVRGSVSEVRISE